MSNFILVAEAARLLGMTPAGVREMEKRGDLPAQRTGDRVRLFDRAVVKRVARARRRDADGHDGDARDASPR